MSSSKRLTLNVGGKIFTTTVHTLSSLPNTRLGRLATRNMAVSGNKQDAELFFDRNPEIVNSILDFHRTGELHLPKHLCGHTVERELEFWGIPPEVIRECCYQDLETLKRETAITEEIDKVMFDPYEVEAKGLSKWNQVWLVMEKPTLCRASKRWAAVYFTLVLLSVLLYTMETSMTFRELSPRFVDYVQKRNFTLEEVRGEMNLVEQFTFSRAVLWIDACEQALLVFFFLEWFVRFATCPDKRRFMRQARNLLDLFCNVHAVLRAILMRVIMPAVVVPENYASTVPNALFAFYCLSLLRLMRIFYLAKDFDSMKMLILSARASVKVLALLTICMLSMATLFGVALYLSELGAETYTFASIPYGMWYAIVTMTTVGYGDVYPTSTAGRLIGTLCALSGVVVIALPVTVLATTFSNYGDSICRREHKRKRESFLKENPEFRTLAAAADACVVPAAAPAGSELKVKVAWEKGDNSQPHPSKPDDGDDGNSTDDSTLKGIDENVKQPGLCFPFALPKRKKSKVNNL